MPEYRYVFFDDEGKERAGVIEAEAEEEALALLRSRNIFPSKIEQIKKKRTKNLPAHVLATFFRQFAALLRTEQIAPPEALRLLEDAIPKKFLPAYRQAQQMIGRGEPFYRALASTGLFPNIAISMIEAGEKSGQLDKVLHMLYQHFLRTYTFNKKLRGALTYPIAILVLALLVTYGLIVFIVPQFTGILEQLNAPIPTLTKIIILISRIASSPLGIFSSILAFVLIFFFARSLLSQPNYRKRFEKFLMRLPVVSPIIKYGTLATIAQTLRLMYMAGILIHEGIEQTRKVVGLLLYRDALAEIRRSLVTGKALHVLFERYPEFFPQIFVQLVRIGEETGNLEEMLEHAGAQYQEETEAILDNLSSFLEPLMLVVVGGLVGVVMLAILLPYFSIAQNLGG